MTPTIALVMIVRNEEENLPDCLESTLDAVDEMVIVDTGSCDRTVEIARRYTNKVYQYPWHNDFSAARNYALGQATSQWILCLDADERLDTTSGDLRSLIRNHAHCEAFFLPLHNLAADSPGGYSRFLVLRFFRNRPEYRFVGVIHEQVVVNRPEVVGIAPAPVIWHKLLPARERRRKRGRNLALLQRATSTDPGNPFLHYYLGVEWLGLGKADRALPCFERACRDLSDAHILFRAPAVRYLVASLKALGRVDEAICVCLEETLRYPEYTDLFFDGGVLLEEKGEHEVAIKWFKEALSCDQPPPFLAHTHGTESFLSLYHLGYCHEKLGYLKEARDYYEQALATNPDYFYPLYNLFLLLLAEAGPKGTYDYFKNAGHLHYPRRAMVLADLFFEAGFPERACACLEEAGATDLPEEYARRLAHFCLYAGRVDQALSLSTSLQDKGTHPELTVDEVVGLILQGDYRRARKKALSLWHHRQERSRTWALLGLISHLQSGTGNCRPEKSRQPEVVRTLLALLENCLRHAPCRGENGSLVAGRYHWLAKEVMSFLTQLSPQAREVLCNYLQEKAGAMRRLLEYKYGPAGRLVP